VVRLTDNEMWVSCGTAQHKKSVLAITEIQRAGSKRIPVNAWLRSNHAPCIGDEFTFQQNTSSPN
ncbi:MAG: hypothetical protein ACRCWJ_23275, partial [Casimicrobium sp.]